MRGPTGISYSPDPCDHGLGGSDMAEPRQRPFGLGSRMISWRSAPDDAHLTGVVSAEPGRLYAGDNPFANVTAAQIANSSRVPA